MSTNYLYLYISINSYIYILTNYSFLGLDWIVRVARSVIHHPTQKPRVTQNKIINSFFTIQVVFFQVKLGRFELGYRIY